MALDITVDVKSPTPPYEQIRSQIAAYVHGGSLTAGTRLPTMRARLVAAVRSGGPQCSSPW